MENRVKISGVEDISQGDEIIIIDEFGLIKQFEVVREEKYQLKVKEENGEVNELDKEVFNSFAEANYALENERGIYKKN